MNPCKDAESSLQLVRDLSEHRLQHDPHGSYRWRPVPSHEPPHWQEPDYVKISRMAQARFKASGGHFEDAHADARFTCPECRRELQLQDGMIPRHRNFDPDAQGEWEWCPLQGRV